MRPIYDFFVSYCESIRTKVQLGLGHLHDDDAGVDGGEVNGVAIRLKIFLIFPSKNFLSRLDYLTTIFCIHFLEVERHEHFPYN